MKYLKDLLKGIPGVVVKGNPKVPIKGVCSNSKTLVPGDLFVAKKGLSSNGADYIPDAINAGASAIMTDLYDSNYQNITQLITSDIPVTEALLSAKFYGAPSNSLLMVGVTGTNGKTTTSYLTKYLLDHLRGPCGLIGTVEYNTGERSIPALHTTPDVTSNHKMLRQMVDSGCQSAVMEVSSHALTQGRVSQIDFDVAVFTNLSQDHLDYHETMEKYGEAKSLLFSGMSTIPKNNHSFKAAVVNCDDPFSEKIVKGCKVAVLTYGIQNQADLMARDIVCEGMETRFSLCYKGKEYACRTPLVGCYNVYNTLGAIGVALTQGFTMEQVLEWSATFPAPPGRMELVKNPLGLRIIVDFAHTEIALENALSSIRGMNPERVITVFGCGGDRDRGKRPKMGAVCAKLSDISIVTSDNPRTEEPLSIISEVLAGFGEGRQAMVEIDRRSAIKKAIEIATPRDIILIAGKGHETTQIISHRRIAFDDRIVAKECCLSQQESSVSIG